MVRPLKQAPSWVPFGSLIIIIFLLVLKVNATPNPTPPTLSPAQTLDCTFENGNFCNWKQDTRDIFKVGNSADTRWDSMYMPYTDDSLSEAGHFAFIDTRALRQTSSLHATNPYPNQEICFQFAYYFYTDGQSSFSLQMSGGSKELIVFRGFGANEDKWRQAQLTITPSGRTYSQVEFKASIAFGAFALDNIAVRPGKCSVNSNEIMCDFELNATCLFRPVPSGNVTFQVYPASKFRLSDHSTHSQDGHFYGVDFTAFGGQGSNPKQVAITSAYLSFRCLRFSYYLAGVLPSTTLFATLYTTVGGGAGRKTTSTQWAVAGSTTGLWFSHKMSIPSEGQSFLRLGVHTLGEPAGKVFLDDIFFTTTPCVVLQNCDFENGDVCNMETIMITGRRVSGPEAYQLAKTANFSFMTINYLTDYVQQTWHVFTPHQSKAYLQHDNTRRNEYGRYLLLSADFVNERGIIVTERYNLADHGGSICLSFTLISSQPDSILEVYQGESFNESHGLKIWDVKRKIDDWETFEILAYPQHKGSVDIFFYIVGTLSFKYVANGPPTPAYFGLDDLWIKPVCTNPANLVPSTVAPTLPPGVTTVAPTPNPDLFTCTDGKSIAIARTCDYIKDCAGGEDETNCGSCDFKGDTLCRYKIKNIYGDYAFDFRDKHTVGPQTDPDGKIDFLVSSGHWGRSYLSSPILQQAYIDCDFDFFYYYKSAEASNNGSLSGLTVFIELTDLARRVPVWESSFGHLQNGEWTYVDLSIGRVKHPFRLVFSSTQGNGTPEMIQAISDPEMSNCGKISPGGDTCNEVRNFKCKNGLCIFSQFVCDFVDDCGDATDEANCDPSRMTSFENGRGLWGLGLSQVWAITPAFASLRYGPTYDHTSGYERGSFLYAHATSHAGNGTVIAQIDSPPFIVGKGCQLSFYVFKNSPQSSLLVMHEDILTGSKEKMLEFEAADYNWKLLVASLDNYHRATTGPFKVIFTATLTARPGDFVDPYIALDDISFSKECTIQTGPMTMPTLPNHSTMTTPKPDGCPTLSCLDTKGKKICLRDTQFCDFIAQCADGSDERDCGDCSFEQGMCQWKNYESVNLWTVLRPASSSPGALPKIDSDGHSDGGYLTIRALSSSSSFIVLSRLLSPRLNGATAESCKLRFSYMSALGANLLVQRFRGADVASLFNVARPVMNWKTMSVDVGVQQAGFNLQFTGTTRMMYGFYEDIAVDNIQLVDCNPYKTGGSTVRPPTIASVSCSFEADLCGWEVTGVSGRSNWMRTSNSAMEPGNDHTSLQDPRPTQYGNWLTTASHGDLQADADYLMTSVALKSGTTYCLTFWYYFLGIDLNSFMALYASTTGQASRSPDKTPGYTALWRTDLPKSRNWNQRYVEIPSQSADFYLMFIAHVDANGIIGLDDTALRMGNCPVDPEFCDFEVNNCDWTIQSGGFQRSPSSATLPDHTTSTGNGHYLQDSITEKSAVLSKPFSKQPIFLNSKSTYISNFCLRFYYYFDADFSNGALSDNSSALTVQILEKGINPVTRSIKMVDALNDGLLHSWSLFQDSFHGSRDGSLEIDALRAAESTKVLLDDISLKQGDCNYDLGCDFEYDNCGWTNTAAASPSSGRGTNLLWLRIQPNSKYISGRYLTYDNTTNSATGHYLVLPLQMQANANALLRSPLYKNLKTACFTMAYFAQAANTSVHALTLQMDDLTRDRRTSVQVNATKSLIWTKFQAQFNDLPSVFVLSLVASKIRGLTSDIGIDDLALKYGSCDGGHVPTTTTPLPVSEKKLDCTFDSGSCNWKYDASVYKAGSFADQKNNYAPQRDHNIGATSGRYLLFEDSARAQTSYLLTTTADLTADRDHCLTFWTYNDGEDPFTLSLTTLLYGNYLWEQDFDFSIESRRRWTLLKVDIARSKGGSVSLQIAYKPTASRRKDFSIFALDDLSVRPGKCSHLHDYLYTFSAGYQDLELEYVQPLAKAIGSLINPQTDLPAGAPAVDHTTGTASGTYFLFANQATLAPTTYITTLSMIDLPADGEATCVRFAYQTKGNVQLKVFVASPDARVSYYKSGTPFWSANYSTNGWTIGEVNKRVTYTHKVVFYMEKAADKTSFAALDDLTILSHRCQAPIDCDFEGRICSYSPVAVNQYNWGLFTAPAVDPAWPGPTFDHTTRHIGSGYLFLTAFRSVGVMTAPVVSRIVSGSRQVKPGKSYCLSLWIRLSTADLALKVSLLRYGASWTDSNRTLVLGSRLNLVQSDWTQVTFQILPNDLLDAQEAQLLIEGTIGVNSKGLIALDDISLTEGACQANTLLCEDGTTLNQTQICNFHKDCPSGLDELNCGNCNFEQGTCGWVNMTTWPQRWLLTSSQESHSLKVPAFDGNANRTGHYLLLGPPAVGRASNGETALNFGSPANYLKNAYQTCVLQFDYFISTYDTYSLNVRMGSDSSDWDNVYLIQRDSKGGWRRAYAHIGERYSDFMTALVGHLADGNAGVIAVDNMQFTNCSLPTPLPAGQTCAAGQTLCRTHRFCIHHDDICDYANNCGDEQDELNCNSWTRCNFEHGYTDCDLRTDDMEAKHVWDVNVEWNIYQGRLARDPYDPQIDSTLRSSKGSYIQLATRSSAHLLPWKQTYTAEFYSTMVTSKGGQACRVRFFFFINGDAAYISATYLDIFVRYASKLTVEPQRLTRLQLNTAGDLQQRWNKAVVPFTSTAPFQFVFRGKLGTNLSRVAVDDITFDYDNCAHSNIKPLTPSTPPPTRTTPGGHSGGPVTVTPKPTVNHPSPKSGVGGKIAAAILIPLFLILGAIGGYFAFRRYQKMHRGDEGMSLSMKNIQQNTDD